MLIAINRHMINKASKADFAKYHGKFENLDLDAEALCQEIKKGHAFCPQLKQGKRSTQGFLAAGFLAVDIDHGLTLETARADKYFRQFATILYTTPSHTSDKHRFRIVFELEQPITDAERMQLALTGLIARFGGDRSCKDAARLFYGSTLSLPEVIGHKLPCSEVEVLVTRGHERETLSDTSVESGPRKSAVRSRINIPRDTVVRTEDGVELSLKEVPTATRIFCPQHTDTRPSAMTLRNKAGNPGLYCSACGATYFLDDGSGRRTIKPYRFDYHWQAILDVSHEEYIAYADDEGTVDISELRGGRIRVVAQRHLTFDELVPIVVSPPRVRFNGDGSVAKTLDLASYSETPATRDMGLIPDCQLTLVKSPKGTGKTEWLGKLVTSYREQGSSVLLVGHRRALISATSHRIGLTCYLGDIDDDADDGPRNLVAPTKHYAVCVDSMPKMNPKIQCYDVVLIDEVEQVFAHLLSETLKEDRRVALHALRHYLQRAKALYVLDADLSNVTVELLHAVFGDESPAYQVIINQWQPIDRVLQLYEQATHHRLLGELVSALGVGERCFVCSNSKRLIEELHAGVLTQSARPLKTLLITSENSQKGEIQSIIRDIKTRALEYDAIFTSPALGTGIDITFEDGAQHIDSVFGFFRARINTHFDIDQQLSRVRNPKRVCAWISGEEFRFETDSEAIKAEILSSEAEHQRFLRFEKDGTKTYDRDEFYETVYCEITAAQRASKNRLKQNFIDLRKSDGWAIEIVGNDDVLAKTGKEAATKGKEERRRLEFERIMQARQVTTDEYEKLRRAEESERLKDADKPVMRRFEIESFYLQDVTLDLLEADDERRLRMAIGVYQTLMTSDEDLRRMDHYAEHSLVPDKPQHGLKKRLLSGLLHEGHVMQDGAFKPDVEVDASMLGEFAAHCFRNKVQIERLLDLNVRGDARRNPINQLKAVLKLTGQSLVIARRDQRGGTSRVFYRLARDRLELVERWVELRSDTRLREVWKRRRSGDEVEEEVDLKHPLIAGLSFDPLDRRT